MHIVFFKFPRDVMQVSTLSAQLSLGSELVNWHRDAAFVAYGQFLIDLLPRTDDRLRYCKNTETIPSKIYVLESLKHPKSLYDEHTKTLYSPSVPIIFLQVQRSFPSVLSKRIYTVSLLMHNKSVQWKSAKHKMTSRGKISKRGLTIVSKTKIL